MTIDYLHNHVEFNDFISTIAVEMSIDPYMVEKDYWIMHCLHELSLLDIKIEFDIYLERI